METEKKFVNKLNEAQQRKKQLQDEKISAKLTDEVILFKKHWMNREVTWKRDIKLYLLYEEEKRKNIKVK